MIVYRNNKSGKGFIFVEPDGAEKAFLVTPLCKVKSLELRLFNRPEEDNERRFLSRGLITRNQKERYSIEMQNRIILDEKLKRARVQQDFENMTLKQKAAWINNLPPHAITKLQELLNC